jgi:transposase
MGNDFPGVPVIMDRAYEGDEIRALAAAYGHEPVVPPKKNRKEPWKYDKELYKRRNIVERFFRRIKEYRRVYTRYDKTDVMYMAFVQFALLSIWLN